MTKREIAYIATAIAAAYNTQFDEYKIKLWYSVLNDLDYAKTEYTLKTIIQTSKFAPTPADIREAYFAVSGNVLTPQEASALVATAISRYGRYRTIDAMDFLEREDKTVFFIVKSIGFYNICNSDPNYLRSEIEKKYSVCIEQERNEHLLSDSVKNERAYFSNAPSREESRKILDDTMRRLAEMGVNLDENEIEQDGYYE